MVDEFKHKARENKFVVRDFVFDAVEIQSAKNELTQLRIEKSTKHSEHFPVLNLLSLNKKMWLSEDNKSKGQGFTLKFQKCHKRRVLGITLQNSGNTNARRDTRGFKVTGAGQATGPWETLVEEELEDLAGTPPVLTFYFPPRNLRLLRFHLLSYWGAGGGLRYFYPITGVQGLN